MDRKVKKLGFLVLWLALVGCDFLPFWPFERNSGSEDVVHLATNFCGVFAPGTGKIYGCRWYPDPAYDNHLTSCRGVWALDVETGEMQPVWDTTRQTGGFEVSRNSRYLFFETTLDSVWGPWSEVTLMLLDLENGVMDSLQPETPIGIGAVSPYTPKRIYGETTTGWGEVLVLWSVDFRTHTVRRETSLVFPGGFYILPGAKGDSIVVDREAGFILHRINYKLWMFPLYLSPPDSFLLKDVRRGKVYRLTAFPPKEMYW
ncbi:MAG: hypothetical protein L3J76_01830, partial [Candidatus Hydrothermae bacterium]|nr:hypothetical protein [Candidatus Hydrothermae bacterium]